MARTVRDRAAPYNRRFLESRLAYRIQELAYGGLKPETVERLQALAEQYDGKPNGKRTARQRRPADRRHAADPRMAGHRAQRHGARRRLRISGPPYKSLSAIARAITGTRWNGWVFFGLKNQRAQAMNKRGAEGSAAPIRKLRCAVYTRKSTEEGLDMEFNSLDAQREACEAYVASQKAEGWVLVPDRYDDGGISGGTLERPALKRLLADIEAGCVDVVVVYKIDRLTRSLMDFAKLVDVRAQQRHLRHRSPSPSTPPPRWAG